MIATALRGWLRRRRWIVIGVGALLLLTSIWWYIAAEDRVCLVVDGRANVVRTRAPRVGDLLATAGVTLAAGDVVEPGRDEEIKEGLTVQVHRAFTVELVVGGESRTVRTIARPVSEVLRACRVSLGDNDRISPDLSQEVKPGQVIRVVRVDTKEITYREEIPPKVVVRKDGNLERGVRKVVKEGSSGLVERTALVRLEDGKVAQRQVLATKWLRWPTDRLVALGTRPIVYTMVTSRGQTVRYMDLLDMTATAYYWGPESCGVNAKGITRTGARATYGVVAVDPRVIPLGTRLYVEGYGFATALDTGSAIKGKKIDLCFNTYREAVMYGKRKIKVYVLAK